MVSFTRMAERGQRGQIWAVVNFAAKIGRVAKIGQLRRGQFGCRLRGGQRHQRIAGKSLQARRGQRRHLSRGQGMDNCAVVRAATWAEVRAAICAVVYAPAICAVDNGGNLPPW